MKRVFVVGAARSGTTLLNSLLMMSGCFADYQAETLLLSVASRRYGEFGKEKERFFDEWFAARQFARAGLTRQEFRDIYARSRSWEELLVNFMDQVAQRQGQSCWSDSTPAHIEFIPQIINRYPDALFIHMVRDGRDVAISQEHLGWIRPAPGQRSKEARLVCGCVQWWNHVNLGMQAEKRWPANVVSFRYEDLVTHPDRVVRSLELFLACDLSAALKFDGETAVGALLGANSGFDREMRGISTAALGRYRKHLTPHQQITLSSLFYRELSHFGYDIDKRAEPPRLMSLPSLKLAYVRLYLRVKGWLRETIFKKVTSSSLEVEPEPPTTLNGCV